MKTSRTALILGFALFAMTALAQAQVYLHTQIVNGANGTGVTTRFHIALDLAANKMTVIVDNTIGITNGNGTKGTVVSFGFNTPFSGLQTTSVTTNMKWLTGQGRSSAYFNNDLINGSSTDRWEEHAPYVIPHATQYNQEFGVSTKDTPNPEAAGLDNVGYGIKYGEVAMFEFTFTGAYDITQANYKNFFGDNFISVYWRDVTKVTTSQVWDSKKKKYVTKTTETNPNGGWDKGHGDFFPPSDGDLPATPEPSTYGLMGAAALLGLVAHRRRKAAKAAKAA